MRAFFPPLRADLSASPLLLRLSTRWTASPPSCRRLLTAMCRRRGFAGPQNLGGPQSFPLHGVICDTFRIEQCGWEPITTGDYTARRGGDSPQRFGRQRPLPGETFVPRSIDQICGRVSSASSSPTEGYRLMTLAPLMVCGRLTMQGKPRC